MKLKQTTLVLALSSITGYAAADLTYRTAYDQNLGNNYQQTQGTSNYQSNPNFNMYDNNYQYDNLNSNTISSVGTKIKGSQTSSSGQNYQQYSYDETRRADLNGGRYYSSNQVGENELSHYENINSDFNSTGKVTRKANTQVRLDASGNEIANSERRLNDSSFDFAADDLTKVKDARSRTYYSSRSNTKYSDNVALDTLNESQNQQSNFNSIQKLDANGQPVIESGAHVYIANGGATQSQSKNATYKSTTNQDGKIISRDPNKVLTNQESSSSGSSTEVAYATDSQGQFVAIQVSSDQRYLEKESTVTNRKNSDSSHNIVYDDSSLVKESRKSSSLNEVNRTSVWDGFNAINNTSTDTTYVKYQDGAQPIGTEESSKTLRHNANRQLQTNINGELVLTNNQPITEFTIENKSSEELYQANYQATHHASGDKQGQDYEILNNGTNSRYSDTATQKRTKSATYNEVKNYADGFVEHAITAANGSAEYKKSMQENIEVDRTINQQLNVDLQQLRSKTVSTENASGTNQQNIKAGSINKTIGNYGSLSGGYLDPNQHILLNPGQDVTESNVRSWVDENGTQRHYVVLGTDLEGKEIRSEVTLENASENKSIQVDTVFKAKNSNHKSEQVNYGQELAYNLTEQDHVDESETSKDGQIIYGSNKSDKNKTIKLYSAGKNALDREIQQAYNTQNMSSNLVLDEQGQVVIKTINTSDTAAKVLLQQYQTGQEKVWNYSSQISSNQKSTDANGKVLNYDNQSKDLDIVQYAQGKNILDRTINTSSTLDVLSNQKLTSTAPYYGVDENGTDLSIRNGVLAYDEHGREVKSTQVLKTTDVDVVNQNTKSKKVAEQVYQSGAITYKKSEQNQQTNQDTFADGYVARSESKSTNDVTLYNHNQSDKYRDAATTVEVSTNNKIYDFNENGESVVKGTIETTSSDKTTAVDYQKGKNALSSSSLNESSYTHKNVLDASTTETKGTTKLENLVYQADQKISEQTTSEFNTDTKVTNKDQSGSTYTTSSISNETVNNTDMGLLASQAVYSKRNIQNVEAKKTTTVDGKITTQNIIRGSDVENRTDQSFTEKVYGSENILNSDGVNTTVANANTRVVDKFGILESDTSNLNTTSTAKDGSAKSVAETRVDNVSGVLLSQDIVQKDASGKETKSSISTTVKAGEVSVGDVRLSAQGVDAGNKVVSNVANGVANNDAVNMGQFRSYTADLNRRFDDVETNAYRGVAISLAAQQAVPNMKPGQFAVFGGMGHYEGQSAGALGITSILEDGRTSFSGAFGVAGGGEVGGRVGVSYVFGGK
ncbi:YadA-like family protein [Acinetobacter sp. P8-3-8]|uniref:YadA-like family protein n=1 Tax=Acinetobacter sp. P8-3-8 TaxID=1029823 RepID=UPI0002486987|nr:YadA-like family protein [Acinetobacter sp. P8-3-8]